MQSRNSNILTREKEGRSKASEMKLIFKLSYDEGKQKTYFELCNKKLAFKMTVSQEAFNVAGLHRCCRKLSAQKGKETSSFDFSSRLFSEVLIADVISKKIDLTDSHHSQLMN